MKKANSNNNRQKSVKCKKGESVGHRLNLSVPPHKKYRMENKNVVMEKAHKTYDIIFAFQRSNTKQWNDDAK